MERLPNADCSLNIGYADFRCCVVLSAIEACKSDSDEQRLELEQAACSPARSGANEMMPRAKSKKRGAAVMPPHYQQLITKGFLLPDPHDPHSMKCARCRLPVILIWNHKPGTQQGKTLPGGVWGKDVSVICMCCSYPHCAHKQQGDNGPLSSIDGTRQDKRFEDEAREIADIACLLINRKASTLHLRTAHPYANQLLLEKVIRNLEGRV